ncbi:uncharacterized protein LOC130726420 isoform X2 [Lotus japonicus]|uniref:uncharacterized protein LOC130726420 isoform X2 n=1 Tax=Lotus japonicus TaxID=34305 RepID=UPI00258B1E55|nr:uncharacterized protein LOC130726420 isoform X2 [Lotus japonicus]
MDLLSESLLKYMYDVCFFSCWMLPLKKDKHCSSTGFVRKKPLSCFMKIHILLIFPREILTIQAKADKEAAGLLLQKYSVMTDDRTTTSCSGKFGEYLVISRPSP